MDLNDNANSLEAVFRNILDAIGQFTEDIDNNIQTLLNELSQSLRADYVQYNIIADGKLFNRCYTGSKERPRYESPAEDYICSMVINNDKDEYLYIPDITLDQYQPRNRILKALGVVSYIGFPVKYSNSVNGVLCAFFKRSYTPNITDILHIRMIAATIGLEEDRLLRVKTLSESEKQYRELYSMLRLMCDNVTDMIWAKDTQNRYLFTNKAFCEQVLVAETTDEPVGKTDMFFAKRQREMHPDDPHWHTFGEICRDSDTVVIDTLKPHQFDEFGNIKGKYIFLDVHKAPFWGPDGNLLGTVGSGRDATKAKEIELALSESQARYQALLEANPDLMILYNEEGVYLDCHSNDPSVMVAPAEQLIGTSVYDHFSKDLADECLRCIKTVKETGQMYMQEYELRVGNSTHFEARYVPCGDNKYLSIIRDITEKKAAEKMLQKSEEQFRRMYETANEGMLILDKEQKITFVNPRFCGIMGCTADELIGKRPTDFMYEEDLRLYMQQMAERHKGDADNYEMKFFTKHGRDVWILVAATPIFDEKGAYSGSFAMLQDITSRKNMEIAMANSLKRYQTQRATLSKLSNSSLIVDGDIEALADEITRLAADTMSTTRVSIWLFNEDRSYLSCLNLYNQKSREYSKAPDLVMHEFEEEYRYLVETGYVDADDAVNDPRTKNYSQSYLIPNGITSMLDVNIRDAGRSYGLICFEHVDNPHHWEQDEISFGCQVADQLALCISNRERRKAEKALKDSEERYRLLIDISPIGIAVHSEGKIVFTNSYGAKLVGVDDPQELIGEPVMTFVHESSYEDAFSRLTRLMKGEKGLYPVEYMFRHRDGHPIPVEVTATVMQYAGKKAVQILITDITERKKAEEATKRNLERLTSIAELLQYRSDDLQEFMDYALNEAIRLTESKIGFIMDCSTVDEGFSTMSSIYLEGKILSHEVERKLPMNIGSIWDDALTTDKAKLYNNYPSSEVYKHDLPGWHSTVSRLAIIPLRVEGKTVALIAVANKTEDYDETDAAQVTLLMDAVWKVIERRRNTEQIRKLSHAVEKTPVSVVITDPKGMIEYVNPFFSKVTGYEPDEVVGKSSSMLKSGLTPPEVYENLWATITRGEIWSGELQNKKASGELYWEYASITPVTDESGRILNFIGLKEDITLQKKMTSELIQARDDAEALNRLKSTFLANMSHELRTPMVGILGYSELLLDMVSDSAQKEMVTTINTSGKRLLSTLNMILDLSRIEANKQDIRLEVFDLVGFIHDQAKLFKANATKKRLSLEVVAETPSLLLNSDSRLLEHVVSDLINNAIKFTEKGGITVTIGRRNTPNGQTAFVSIKDTGIGIPADRLEVIFEGFRQVSEGYDRSYDGTGLGLTISRKYMQLLGGTLSVESELNQGSTFTISFPEHFIRDIDAGAQIRTNDARNEPRANGIPRQVKPRLLLVDDDLISYKLMERVLRDVVILEHADTGEKGLEMVKSYAYPTVLVDINLRKGMSGLQLLKHIRELPEYLGVPIIAVTAYSMVGDKERFLAAGCTHYLSKPYNHAELVDLIKGVISG